MIAWTFRRGTIAHRTTRRGSGVLPRRRRLNWRQAVTALLPRGWRGNGPINQVCGGRWR